MMDLLMSSFEESKSLAAEALLPTGYSGVERCEERRHSSQRARTDV